MPRSSCNDTAQQECGAAATTAPCSCNNSAIAATLVRPTFVGRFVLRPAYVIADITDDVIADVICPDALPSCGPTSCALFVILSYVLRLPSCGPAPCHPASCIIHNKHLVLFKLYVVLEFCS